jgi:hypothetical protein
MAAPAGDQVHWPVLARIVGTSETGAGIGSAQVWP